MSDFLNLRHYKHPDSGLPFYEARDALGELRYIQQYDEATRRGVGARISYWNEGDAVCMAKGYAIEEVPGLPNTSQWHGDVRVQNATSSFTAKNNPPITDELRQCISNNELKMLESSIDKNRKALQDYLGSNNPKAVERLKEDARVGRNHDSSLEP